MRHFRYDPFARRAREQCTVGALRAEAAGVDVSVRSRGPGRERPSRPTLASDLAARVASRPGTG